MIKHSKNELRQKYHREELSHEEKFIQYHFWDLEQTDIEYGMPALVERAYNGEASRDELISLIQKTHALKTQKIPLPCEVDYQKITLGLDKRSENVKNGTVQEPNKYTFIENSQIDEEAIPLNEKIEKMGELMYAWENRQLLISYLRGDGDISLYSLNNMCIETFDDELYHLFSEKYMSSTNGDRVELCQLLLWIDFKNSPYSTPVDIETTRKNYKALILMLKELSEGSTISIDNAIHKSFIEKLERRVEEIPVFDKA